MNQIDNSWIPQWGSDVRVYLRRTAMPTHEATTVTLCAQERVVIGDSEIFEDVDLGVAIATTCKVNEFRGS